MSNKLFSHRKMKDFLYEYQELQQHREDIQFAIECLERAAATEKRCVLLCEEAEVHVSNEFALPIFRADLEITEAKLQHMSSTLEKTGL